LPWINQTLASGNGWARLYSWRTRSLTASTQPFLENKIFTAQHCGESAKSVNVVIKSLFAVQEVVSLGVDYKHNQLFTIQTWLNVEKHLISDAKTLLSREDYLLDIWSTWGKSLNEADRYLYQLTTGWTALIQLANYAWSL
jgi:hypothetical protein